MEITKIFGQISPEQIAEWKKAHRVKEIAIAVSKDRKVVGYFMCPDFPEMMQVQSFMEAEPFRAMAVLYDACLLGGDVEFSNDLSVKMAGAKELMGEIKPLATTVKNL